MAEDFANGLEFLKALSKQSGKREQSYRVFSRYLDHIAREKGIPLHGQFELTPLCNFSCKMCYVHLDRDQLAGREVLPVEKWKDLMHQAWEAGMIYSTLTGGECLAYPGFDEVYLYLRSLGCDPSILTNGYFLDERRIEFFRKHRPSLIQITLYGWNDDVYERVTGHRAFSTIVENARKAIEAGLRVTITVTPSKFLGEDILETIRTGMGITKEFSVNANLFTPREETGRAQEQVEMDPELYVRYNRLLYEMHGQEPAEIDEDKLPPPGGPSHECDQCGLKCGGGRSGFVMNWKGELLACNRLDHHICASALEEGFRKAWARVNDRANHWPRVPECEGCPYEKVCFNCAANMLLFSEPGKMPRILCEMTKKYVRRGFRHIPDCE
jgi:radical SAM protein with 4Fe4S-binding SPASM domain